MAASAETGSVNFTFHSFIWESPALSNFVNYVTADAAGKAAASSTAVAAFKHAESFKRSTTRHSRQPALQSCRRAVGSFSSCPVFVAHHLSASGFVLAAPVWKRRTPRRGVEVRLRQLSYRPVLLLCRPLCWWPVSLFDLRAVSSSRPALAQ